MRRPSSRSRSITEASTSSSSLPASPGGPTTSATKTSASATDQGAAFPTCPLSG